MKVEHRVKIALCKGDFKNSVKEQPGSASFVKSVNASSNGIGYSGIAYGTSGLKAGSLAETGGPTAAEIPAEREFFKVVLYKSYGPLEPYPPIDGPFNGDIRLTAAIKDGYTQEYGPLASLVFSNASKVPTESNSSIAFKVKVKVKGSVGGIEGEATVEVEG